MPKKFIVNKDYHNSRFDRWFKQNVSDVPQSLIEKFIRKNKVKINRKKTNAKKEKDEIINDLIVAAYNDAKDKLKKKTSEEIIKVTGIPNLPFDFKLPF